MKITHIGYNYTHDSSFFVSRPHGSGDNLLLLLRTSALFNINGNEIRVPENSFILYKEGTPQFYRTDGEKFVNDWFHFSFSEDEANVFEALEIPFDMPRYIGDVGHFSAMIERMCYEYYSDNLYHSYTEGLYLKLFFTKLGEYLQSHGDKRISSHYEQLFVIRGRIYSTPQYEWSIKELADEMAMSVSYFEHMYKKIFGISVMNEVINSRIGYAKFMLATTDVPVNRIAEMCGYKSNVHFIKQFKSRTYLTPSQYREANKKY